MDHEEEQAMEIEALQSIYIDGQLKVDKNSLWLAITPGDLGEEKVHVSLTLHVVYPPAYPKVAPLWELEDVKGLDDSALVHLKLEIDKAVESNLGCPMVFTMADVLSGLLKKLNHPPRSMHDEMLARKDAISESADELDSSDSDYQVSCASSESSSSSEEEEGKVDNRVTEEEFLSWSERFRDEKIATGEWGDNINRNSGSLTGKQIFELIASSDGKEGYCENSDLFQEELDESCLSDASDSP